MSDIDNRGYANPDILVSTDWVAEHSDAPSAEQIIGISPDLMVKFFGRNISRGKGQGLMAMVP